MKKFLNWVGIVFGALVGLIIVGLIVIYFKTQARLTHVYEVPNEAVAIPADSASIARGKHIFQFRGYEACHSEREYLSRRPGCGESRRLEFDLRQRWSGSRLYGSGLGTRDPA
jgi:hypothetical protein